MNYLSKAITDPTNKYLPHLWHIIVEAFIVSFTRATSKLSLNGRMQCVHSRCMKVYMFIVEINWSWCSSVSVLGPFFYIYINDIQDIQLSVIVFYLVIWTACYSHAVQKCTSSVWSLRDRKISDLDLLVIIIIITLFILFMNPISINAGINRRTVLN